MAKGATKGERRERKKRKRMPVTGKQVFGLQRLMSRGTGRRDKAGRQSIRASHRIHKPKSDR